MLAFASHCLCGAAWGRMRVVSGGWGDGGEAPLLPPKVQHLLHHRVAPLLRQHVRVVRDREIRQVDEPRQVVGPARPLQPPFIQKLEVLQVFLCMSA